MTGRNELFLAGLLQLTLIGLSCVLGYYLSRQIDLIPSAILRLPEVYVSLDDMWSLTRIFVVVYLIQIFISNLRLKSHGFASVRRFATEYVFYLFAYTTASLYSFLATTINYDPQLIAAIGLISTGFYLLAMMLLLAVRDRYSPGAAVGQPIWSLVKRLVSVSGVLALLYFFLPLALGMAFTSSRDVANRITQIRIFFNPSPQSEWGLRNLYPNQVFEQPILVKQAPGETDSLYVLERVGRIYKVPFPQGGEKELVLDIRDQLGEVEVENGALGMAFHPRFNQAGDSQFLYLYYTDTRPQEGQLNKLSRFDLSNSNLETRKASEFQLMSLPRVSDGFHNGGSLEFGDDGYLYMGIGEGVHPRRVRTSAAVLRAGMLRLDVDNRPSNLLPEPMATGQLQGYRVPADNPFVDRADIRAEYWALGLRNPFRFTFDPATGELWVGDVGSTIWEEVNRIEKGLHYQFPVVEGRNPTGRAGWEDLNLTQQGPVYTYQHDAYDRAVIGGVVYRGDRYPSLQGQYVFADNYSAKIFVIPADQQQVDEAQEIARASQYAQRGVSSVVQLDSGEILVTTLGAASEPSGEVLLLVAAEDADVVEDRGDTATEESVEYDEVSVASLFAVNCARCHGEDGAGQGPDASLLGVELPDFTSLEYQSGTSAERLYDVIAEGGAAVGISPMMPPWDGALSSQEIEHLVRYIESLPNSD